MIIFLFKYSVVIISQIRLIQFCLTMDQWLTAFISIERAYTIIKGVDFTLKNKIKYHIIEKS